VSDEVDSGVGSTVVSPDTEDGDPDTDNVGRDDGPARNSCVASAPIKCSEPAFPDVAELVVDVRVEDSTAVAIVAKGIEMVLLVVALVADSTVDMTTLEL
jgi:hypothetical protein